MNTITLYRPVGLTELMLIKAAGWKAFPPRLVWQPVFYPVLHEDYAAQIAREWNTADAFSGFLGAVTAFSIAAADMAKYEVQNVGGAGHNELWIPADELAAFNSRIQGEIRVTKAFFGSGFKMPGDSGISTLLSTFYQQ